MVTQKTAAKETTPVAYVKPHPPPDKVGRLCRGEGVATHGLAFRRRSFSPFFRCRGEGAVTRRLPHQLHEWLQQFKMTILQLWAL